ncbi:unnamed protein product [Symbiodinium sp. CCMP2592]|nr:unnamed protein product [Symbiodinium sp. CCMP2592]
MGQCQQCCFNRVREEYPCLDPGLAVASMSELSEKAAAAAAAPALAAARAKAESAFQSYYVEHVKTISASSDAMQNLYSKFPLAPKPVPKAPDTSASPTETVEAKKIAPAKTELSTPRRSRLSDVTAPPSPDDTLEDWEGASADSCTDGAAAAPSQKEAEKSCEVGEAEKARDEAAVSDSDSVEYRLRKEIVSLFYLEGPPSGLVERILSLRSLYASEAYIGSHEMATLRYLTLLLMSWAPSELGGHVATLSLEQQSHSVVAWALQACEVASRQDWPKFLSLYTQADFLSAVAMERAATYARHGIMRQVVESCRLRHVRRMSLAKLKSMVAVRDTAFFKHYGLRVVADEDAVELTGENLPAALYQGKEMLVAKFKLLGLSDEVHRPPVEDSDEDEYVQVAEGIPHLSHKQRISLHNEIDLLHMHGHRQASPTRSWSRLAPA